MTKIFESEYNGWDESVTKMHVYALEDDKEYWRFDEMNFDELCEYFNVHDEYNVAPGARYKNYSFHLEGRHLIVYETVAFNV